MGLCDLVRASCATVMEGAAMVSISNHDLASYAHELRPAVTKALSETTAAFGSGTSARTGSDAAAELTATRVIALDAINFGSGYHDVIAKIDGLSGASSMATRLSECLATAPAATTAEWLADLTPRACAEIFGQSLEHEEQRELMDLFAVALSDLGRFVASEHDHSFGQLVASADGSAERLAESLLAMPFYRDRVAHAGVEVHFYKRAQLTAADLARAGYVFNDLGQLTAFADNLVPHVLRLDGVLAVDAELVSSIDSGRRLELGSTGEVELRAAAVVAIERIGSELRRQLPTARPMDIDLALWLRGSAASYKARRRHRTRCVYY